MAEFIKRNESLIVTFLCSAVVFLGAWGVKIEVGNAQQAERHQALVQSIDKHEQDANRQFDRIETYLIEIRGYLRSREQ